MQYNNVMLLLQMWTSALRIRVKMGAHVVIKSMDTLANAPQDTMVITVVMVSIRN